ncbi:hypothetical protein MUN78_07150 [Leucobacter allii]|uniref:HTH cro/C1-type domain-containing protein n=1 Tax=Leucobacter allii TaxID=2932247 RepID=A0ABY4FQL8_9MICO|nr:hypothetical protein [Leucobacter allii]UOQ58594.1 hypothetical protein MUN78_07150 [Leucobacter allii]
MAKNLLPIDALIARYLREGIIDAGISYRQLAAVTGMSINRIGIILRQEPPPATVGETGQLARAIGLTASELLARAEREHSERPVGDAQPDPVSLDDRREQRCERASDETLRAVASQDDGLPDAQDGDDQVNYDHGDPGPDDPFHTA